MMGMSISTVTTIVREPARLHMVTTGPMSMEMYVVDGFLYTHLGSTAWQKRECRHMVHNSTWSVP